MAFDELTANRVRKALAKECVAFEKRMFGGLCFLLDGHMLCGIVGEEFMVRAGPESHAEALTQPHARQMDFTGRPMKGMVFVSPDGISDSKALRSWLRKCLAYVRSLPPKG